MECLENQSQGSEEIVEQNVKQYHQELIDCLNPITPRVSQFANKYNIETNSSHVERQKSVNECIVAKIHEQGAYLEFLEHINSDNEHMGHSYLASVLNGKPYGDPSEKKKSEEIKFRFDALYDTIVEKLDVDSLRTFIYQTRLITLNELEYLAQPSLTMQAKAMTLLNLLKTKGPTAHFIFVIECLGKETEHVYHTELYKAVMKSQSTCVKKRPRDTSNNSSPVSKKIARGYEDLFTIKKRMLSIDAHSLDGHSSKIHIEEESRINIYPRPLSSPRGLTTKRYFSLISKIRRFHQTGGYEWEFADRMCDLELGPKDNPLEIKVAILLETCNLDLYRKQYEAVQAKVKKAKEQCQTLYTNGCNAQFLEARCEWILSKLFRFKKDYNEAQKHLGIALVLISACECREDRVMLMYTQACLLLSSKAESSSHKEQAYNNLAIAIKHASQDNVDSGLGIPIYGLIRMAQVLIASSPSNPCTNNQEFKATTREALCILEKLKLKEMYPRTESMYLLTKSDALRINGQPDEALKVADLALKLSRDSDLTYEIELTKVRQQLATLELANK